MLAEFWITWGPSFILASQFLSVALSIALLNRFRGGGFLSPVIPVKSLWLVFPLIGLIALPYQGVYQSIALSVAYLLWALPPWGLWFDHGRMALLNREYTKYEIAVENVSGFITRRLGIHGYKPQDILSHFFRHLLIVPALTIPYFVFGNAMFLYISIPFAIAIVLCYEVAWILWDHKKTDSPIEAAELFVGCLWGALILIA